MKKIVKKKKVKKGDVVGKLKDGSEIKFVAARGPFTDWDGKPLPTVEIARKDLKKIRELYKVKESEYDEMIKVIGAWVVNKKTNFKSFVFISDAMGTTPKMIVISEKFLKELLKKYN